MAVGVVLLVGCGGPAGWREGFDSPDPASRLRAIVRAGHRRQHEAVPDLIEALESDDPVVRMMAIGALERITGTRRGYNPYGPPVDRQGAVDAWLEAWRRGQLEAAPTER